MTEIEIYSSWFMSVGMVAASLYVAFRVHGFIGFVLTTCYITLAAQSYILIYTSTVSWGADGLIAPSWYGVFQGLRSACAIALPIMLFLLARRASPRLALNKEMQEETR